VNRRSFLSMVGFVAPVVIAKPTYFFAPIGGWGVKLYSVIGAWADYPSRPIRTATGLHLHYEQQFRANLKAATPLVQLLRDPRLPKLVEASGYRLIESEVDRVCWEVNEWQH
jgi:hypothetical protein